MFQVASCDCPGTSIAPGPPHSSLLPTLMALLTSGEFKILSSQVSTIVCFYPSCSFMSYPTENRRIYISFVLIDKISPSVALLPCLMTNVALYAQERGQNWKFFLNSKSWWTSLISVDSPAYGCLEANPSGKVYVFINFICLFIFHSLNQSAHPLILQSKLTWTQVECREDTRDTCVLEEVIDPRMITDGRDGTTVSKMWKHVKNVKVKVIQVMDPQIIRDERDGSPL